MTDNTPGHRKVDRTRLKLYVKDTSEVPDELVGELGSRLPTFDIAIISVAEDPEIATRDGIEATPTFVLDRPRRRIVGEFKDADAVATYLSLPEW